MKFPRATHRVVLCRSKKEAEKALADARKILESLELTLHPSKTRIVHIRQGFEFLGYKLKQGKGLKLPEDQIKKGKNMRNIYAIPTEKSVNRFMDTIKLLSENCFSKIGLRT